MGVCSTPMKTVGFLLAQTECLGQTLEHACGIIPALQLVEPWPQVLKCKGIRFLNMKNTLQACQPPSTRNAIAHSCAAAHDNMQRMTGEVSQQSLTIIPPSKKDTIPCQRLPWMTFVEHRISEPTPIYIPHPTVCHGIVQPVLLDHRLNTRIQDPSSALKRLP